MTGVATDLEDIWLNAIEKHLNIQKKDLSRFKVSMCVILGFKVRTKINLVPIFYRAFIFLPIQISGSVDYSCNIQ